MDKILEHLDKHLEGDLVEKLILEEDKTKAMEIRAEIRALRRLKGEIKILINGKT